MIIYRYRLDEGVRYYKHTTEGRAVFGSKQAAVHFEGAELERVTRHLRIMCPAEEIGTWKFDVRFKRPPPTC